MKANTWLTKFGSSYIYNNILCINSSSREDHLLIVLARLVASRLQQHQRIANLAITAADVFPLESSGVKDGQLAEAVVLVVENGSDVLLALAGAELAVALNVSGRAVDEVSHGLSGIGVVGVVVDNGGSVDGTVHAEREETLVPVDVAKDSLVTRVLRFMGIAFTYPEIYASTPFSSIRSSNAWRRCSW